MRGLTIFLAFLLTALTVEAARQVARYEAKLRTPYAQAQDLVSGGSDPREMDLDHVSSKPLIGMVQNATQPGR